MAQIIIEQMISRQGQHCKAMNVSNRHRDSRSIRAEVHLHLQWHVSLPHVNYSASMRLWS